MKNWVQNSVSFGRREWMRLGARTPYCVIGWPENRRTFAPNPDDNLIHDLMAKILHRGELAYCSTLEEEWILKWYGEHYGIRDKEEKGSITYQYSPELKKAFSAFRDLLEPWNGEIQSIQLDPEHPENERRLVSQLLEEFGIRLPHTLTPQVELENILADQDRRAFQGQRGDLLLPHPTEGPCYLSQEYMKPQHNNI